MSGAVSQGVTHTTISNDKLRGLSVFGDLGTVVLPLCGGKPVASAGVCAGSDADETFFLSFLFQCFLHPHADNLRERKERKTEDTSTQSNNVYTFFCLRVCGCSCIYVVNAFCTWVSTCGCIFLCMDLIPPLLLSW